VPCSEKTTQNVVSSCLERSGQFISDELAGCY